MHLKMYCQWTFFIPEKAFGKMLDNDVLDMVQVDYVRKLNRLYGVTDETRRLKDRVKELEAELGRYRAKEDFLRGWYGAYSVQRKKDFDRDRGDD